MKSVSNTLPPAIFVEPNDGCLTAARALVRRGVAVHGLANPRGAYIVRSRAIRGTVLPPLSQGHGPWLDRLAQFAGSGGVLIAGSDPATEFLSTARSSIPADLRSYESEDSAHLRLMDKRTLYEAAHAAGVRCPWVLRAASHDVLADVVGGAEYPCIVKPEVSHRGRAAGDFRTTLVEDAASLRALLGRALEAGVAMIVTEWIPGPESGLEGAVTLRTADGRYPLEYGRRKIRQHPIDLGSGSLLRCARVPETMALAKRLVESVGFVGISSFEAKHHAVTGERVLTEINVRVPLNFGLGEACGVQASWRLYATMAGLPLGPQPEPRYGRKVLISWLDARAVRTRMARGELSAREALRSYRGIGDSGVLDLRDPLPAVVLARGMLNDRAAKHARPTAPQGARSGAAPHVGLCEQ